MYHKYNSYIYIYIYVYTYIYSHIHVYISATVPPGTTGVFIMCLRGPCHGDPGWNVELFKGTPPPGADPCVTFSRCRSSLFEAVF